MPDFTEDELENMKAWAKDPKGAPFWATLREMFAEGVHDLRAEARSNTNNTNQVPRLAGHIDTLEEILDLPALIIQNAAKEKADARV